MPTVDGDFELSDPSTTSDRGALERCYLFGWQPGRLLQQHGAIHLAPPAEACNPNPITLR